MYDHLTEMLFIFPRALSLYLILSIIFIITFYFLERFLSNHFQKSKLNFLIAFVLTTLIVLGLYVAYLFAFSSYGDSMAFDKPYWDAYYHKRSKMANDIIDTEMLIGKDTSQTKQILGAPNSTASTIWYYSMGLGKDWFGYFSYNLAVKFDYDRVSKVAQFTTRE